MKHTVVDRANKRHGWPSKSTLGVVAWMAGLSLAYLPQLAGPAILASSLAPFLGPVAVAGAFLSLIGAGTALFSVMNEIEERALARASLRHPQANDDLSQTFRSQLLNQCLDRFNQVACASSADFGAMKKTGRTERPSHHALAPTYLRREPTAASGNC